MRKILVMDDDNLTRVHFKQLLIDRGFEVTEATNGQEAISIYQDIRPDMVLMDIATSHNGGVDALKDIKEFDSNAQVAVFIVEGQQALALEALKAGAVDFVVKPFGQDEVLEIVEKALG